MWRRRRDESVGGWPAMKGKDGSGIHVYDVASVRGRYSSLGDGWTYLNSCDCPQIPERVSSHVARAFRTAPAPVPTEFQSGSHAQSPAGLLEGDLNLRAARVAVADLCGASPDRVVLGPSREVLYRALLQGMRPMLRGSSIVATRWERPGLAAALADATEEVRWAVADLGTGDLPAFQFGRLASRNTRLVALPAAHETLGVVAPVAEIARLSHEAGRVWVLVDATTYACYRPISLEAWDADILALDLGALGGPQLSALVFRDALMFKRLAPNNPLATPGTAGVIETPVAPGLAGGVSPLVDHYADLTEATGPRHTRLRESLPQLERYLAGLGEELVRNLSALPSVHILGLSGEVAYGATPDRIPRLSFAVHGVPAATVHRRMYDNGLLTVVTPMSPLLEDMGAAEIDGTVTVALSPFSQRYDVEQLTRVVASLA